MPQAVLAQCGSPGQNFSLSMPAISQIEPQETRAEAASRDSNAPLGAGALRQAVGWAASNRRRAVLVIIAAGVSVGVVVAGGVWVASLGRAESEVALADVLALLDRGEYTQAKEAAETLRGQRTASLDDLAGAVYALGVATAEEADETVGRGRQDKFLLAARYLEEARSRGFPPGRRSRGLFLLGKSLYEGGRIPASRTFLTAALRADPTNRAEIHRLLAGAYLNDSAPDLEKALHYSDLYLAERNLPPAKQQDGLMQRAQILLAMGNPDECMAILDRIPAQSTLRAEATILHGQVQMHQASALKNESEPTPRQLEEARQLFQEAIKTLQLAQGRDTITNHATRKSMYLIGVCFQEIGDYRAALRQFARTRQLFPETPEGMAASFQEAEIARNLGRDDDAVASYRRALEAFTDPKTFSNPWLTVRELRLRLLEAYEYFLQTRNFAAAEELSKLLHPLFPEVRALELQAEVHRTWGGALLAEAGQYSPAAAETFLREGRRQFREAGRLHARLAELLITTRRYPDQLWESGLDYMRGHSYTAAIGMLREYLKDQARQRHPQALVMLGEAYLAQGKVPEAVEAFQECVDFHPRDAAAYQARLLASRAWREQGEPAKAEKLLLENLTGEHLTPASQQWRESLFDLGELFSEEGRFEEATVRLEEALVRYPEDPRATTIRYLLAESYRRAALTARDQLREDLVGSARLASIAQIARHLERALAEFVTLRDLLTERQESRDLTDSDRAILRNACFAIGDVEFELERYDRAIQAYGNATDRYQGSPEVLDAYVRIADAYRRLGDSVQARIALEQAKSVLSRMKPDVSFSGPTNFNRTQWGELLEYLSEL